MKNKTFPTKKKELLLTIGGFIALFLVIVALILPLIPASPFLVLTIYCFSKGNKKIHQWLLDQPLIGKYIKEWEKNQVMSPKVKIAVSSFFFILTVGTWVFSPSYFILKIIVSVIFISMIIYVITRPSKH